MMTNAQDNTAYSEARTNEILKALFKKGETIDSYRDEILNEMPMRELLFLDLFGISELRRQCNKANLTFYFIMILSLILVFGNIFIENSYYDWAVMSYCVVAIIGLLGLLIKQKRINIVYENSLQVHEIWMSKSEEKYKLSDDID